MNRCKVCNKYNIKTLSDILLNKSICSECQNKLFLLNKTYNFEGHELLVLYKYDEVSKHLLYQYKGAKDAQLASVFIDFFKFYLKEKYRKYSFYCAPSNEEDNKVRGFNHVEEIAKCISKKVFCPFSKNTNWKQVGKTAKEREQIRNVIEYKEIDRNERVVLIDDVITTGSTLRACLEHLKHKKDVKILIIFKNEFD